MNKVKKKKKKARYRGKDLYKKMGRGEEEKKVPIQEEQILFCDELEAVKETSLGNLFWNKLTRSQEKTILVVNFPKNLETCAVQDK